MKYFYKSLSIFLGIVVSALAFHTGGRGSIPWLCKSSKWCPNATALFYYQPCDGTCGLLQTEISQIKCPSNPDYCMDKGKNKSIIGLVLLALKWSGWAEVSAINWEPCKVEDLNFSPLKELLREKEWQFICVNLYALDLSAHYGNTSCGLFKRGVQN